MEAKRPIAEHRQSTGNIAGEISDGIQQTSESGHDSGRKVSLIPYVNQAVVSHFTPDGDLKHVSSLLGIAKLAATVCINKS